MKEESTPFEEIRSIKDDRIVEARSLSTTKEKITHDAGLSQSVDASALINNLLDGSFLSETNGQLSLTPQGEELLAKVWLVHEQTENLILDGFSDEEKAMLMEFLIRIQGNCEKHTEFQ